MRARRSRGRRCRHLRTPPPTQSSAQRLSTGAWSQVARSTYHKHHKPLLNSPTERCSDRQPEGGAGREGGWGGQDREKVVTVRGSMHCMHAWWWWCLLYRLRYPGNLLCRSSTGAQGPPRPRSLRRPHQQRELRAPTASSGGGGGTRFVRVAAGPGLPLSLEPPWGCRCHRPRRSQASQHVMGAASKTRRCRGTRCTARLWRQLGRHADAAIRQCGRGRAAENCRDRAGRAKCCGSIGQR